MNRFGVACLWVPTMVLLGLATVSYRTDAAHPDFGNDSVNSSFPSPSSSTVGTPFWRLAPTSAMTSIRFDHTATLLPDSTVLIAGGYASGAYAQPLSSSELYDPVTGSFAAIGDMTTARYGHTATLLQDGRVLIAGGENDIWTVGKLASAEVYDPATRTFTRTGDMSEGRAGATATRLPDGKVLITGGFVGYASRPVASSADMYDPITGRFSPVGPMSFRRFEHAAVLLADGRVLVVGGSDYSGSNLSAAEVFEPSTGAFSPTGSMSTNRAWPAATLLPDGSVLVVGGDSLNNNNGRTLDTAEVWNPSTGSFTPTSNMSYARQIPAATLFHDDLVLITGGTLDVEVYDAATGRFRIAGHSAAYRSNHTATLLNGGTVLLAGGNNPADHGGPLAELATVAFDADPPAGSVTINLGPTTQHGAVVTAAPDVAVALSATDDWSGVSQYRLSQDGSAFTAWSPYTAAVAINLGTSDGLKTVYAQFEDTVGNVSTVYSDTILLDQSAGSDNGVSINDGAFFTNNALVTLTLPAKGRTAEMEISNDGGFGGATWEPYALHRSWQILNYNDYVLPRVVYARFKDVDGYVSATYQDDIIMDVTPPVGSASIISQQAAGGLLSSSRVVTLALSATDDRSGVGGMRLSNHPSLSDASWNAYSTRMSWDLQDGNTVYAQFRDNAGNASQTYSASAPNPRSFHIDLGLIMKGAP